jgi:aryl-alcohol dehydrogenase-like predicted oxidoreductase
VAHGGARGLVVGAIGYGAMSFGRPYGQRAEQTADASADELIGRAVELGATLIDTSDGYRDSELFIGKAIKGRRGKVVIATKFGIVRALSSGEPPIINGRPEYVRERIERSLTRLETDRVDLYYQHRVDPDVPIGETVGAMAELVAEGRVLHLGLSEAAPRGEHRSGRTHPHRRRHRPARRAPGRRRAGGRDGLQLVLRRHAPAALKAESGVRGEVEGAVRGR